MATLVLSAVGGALFGPVGAAVGTVLGAVADRQLAGALAPARQGPRLANLAVQSSAYGEPIPRVYGRMRVAGNLVWTDGIKESSRRSGGGKAGPRTTNYSYSASFAVMLAGRAIDDIGRVWADGAELRDAAGAWASPVTMRVHRGDERQPADPLIGAAEGPDAPAYRGRAYAVFEDLPLGDFGNRIPNLTFEVLADRGGVSVAAVADDLAGGAATVVGAGFPGLDGFAAARAGSVRAQLETLALLVDLTLEDDGDRLRLTAGAGGQVVAIDAGDIGATAAGAPSATRDERRTADGIAEALTYGFQDPSRDFQAGVQRAVRRTPVVREERLDVPAAMTPGAAKALAGAALARGAAGRRTARAALPWRHAGIRPGATLRLGDDARVWRVRRRVIEGAVASFELEALAGATALGAADGGRSTTHPALAAGLTTWHALDLPPLPGALPVTPRLWVAAAGASQGWRGAAASVSGDGGESYQPAGAIAAASMIGVTTTALAAGSPSLWDRATFVEVELLSAAMTLESRSEAAVLAGANLALIGDELIQFAEAEPVGPRRYRLRGLLRGRRGGEALTTSHGAGARLVLIEPEALLAVDPPLDVVGATLRVRAEGPGDPPGAPPVEVVLAGAALRPLSPAHLRAARDGGGVSVTWVRRSRSGWAWSDGVDAPLGEADERYRVRAALDGTVVREALVSAPGWTWPAADFALAGGEAGTRLTLVVTQLGAIGDGAAATIELRLN